MSEKSAFDVQMAELADTFDLDELAPGVFGYTVAVEGALYIPLVQAEREGRGDVGRFLDGLPRDRRVVFPSVINVRLEGMLKRRGFTPVMEWCEELECPAEVWERKP